MKTSMTYFSALSALLLENGFEKFSKTTIKHKNISEIQNIAIMTLVQMGRSIFSEISVAKLND